MEVGVAVPSGFMPGGFFSDESCFINDYAPP